jgi:hypothetical protein
MLRNAGVLRNDAAIRILAVVGIGAVAGVAAWAWTRYSRMREVVKQHQQGEKVHDKTLKDSFPASDPPASQYFDIPVNRQ